MQSVTLQVSDYFTPKMKALKRFETSKVNFTSRHLQHLKYLNFLQSCENIKIREQNLEK